MDKGVKMYNIKVKYIGDTGKEELTQFLMPEPIDEAVDEVLSELSGYEIKEVRVDKV